MNYRGELPSPQDVERAIEELLDYLWDDEFRSFQETDAELKEHHVFLSLLLIRRWFIAER